MSRIAQRILARHLGVWLAVVGAGLVAVVGLTVSDLRAEAAERRGAQFAFLQLADDTRHLDRIVLESLARGRADTATFTEVECNGRAIDAQLARDTAARLGGDEFGILLEGVPDIDHAVAVTQRILDAFTEPFSIRGLPVPLRASVGVAIGVAQTISAAS